MLGGQTHAARVACSVWDVDAIFRIKRTRPAAGVIWRSIHHTLFPRKYLSVFIFEQNVVLFSRQTQSAFDSVNFRTSCWETAMDSFAWQTTLACEEAPQY